MVLLVPSTTFDNGNTNNCVTNITELNSSLLFNGNMALKKREKVRRKGRWAFVNLDSFQLQELIGGRV